MICLTILKGDLNTYSDCTSQRLQRSAFRLVLSLLIYFITNFNKCLLTPRQIKEKFRRKFGYACMHASDDNKIGEIEIKNIKNSQNNIIYKMTHVERENSLKDKGYFI